MPVHFECVALPILRLATVLLVVSMLAPQRVAVANDMAIDQSTSDDAPPLNPSTGVPSSAGAECGLYSVIAALKALSLDIDAESILRGQYMSVEWGSTGADLCRAISDAGAYAVPMKSIGRTTLNSACEPIILNLRTRQDTQCIGHWIAYLGCNGDRAYIYDSNAQPQLISMSFAELLSYMSGDGIRVFASRPSIMDRSVPLLELLFELWPVALIGIAPRLRAEVQRMREPILSLGFRQAVTLGCIGLLWALLLNSMPRDGLLRNPEVTGWIQAQYIDNVEFPSVGYHQLEALRQRADVTIVDARSPSAYEFGHIPMAVNVPVDSRPSVFWEHIETIPHSNVIIVYCNNEQCGWAEIVARRFAAMKFKRLFLFPSGLAGYIEQRSNQPSDTLNKT